MRAIAIYLPQFHPIPENDEWWGKGFTEWTNVVSAKPQFKDHYQPHLPADLGFYDLRVPETRQAQADLAKEYGIHGFCYYHYWFNGKRLLNRPFDEVIATGKPDFPFMLCWANENWTRRWDGLEYEILLKQDYSHEDDLLHIRHLCKYFADPRYIKVDNKPFFIIYKPDLFPDIKKTLEIWREEAQKLGIGELYLAYMFSPFTVNNADVFLDCFDAAVDFSVHGNRNPPYDPFLDGKITGKNFFPKLKRKISTGIIAKTRKNRFFSYSDLVKYHHRELEVPFKLYPSVFPGWDNTARNGGNSIICKGSTPQLYQEWLQNVLQKFVPFSQEEDFVFINAWNEWAEGNHLEPCQKWGRAYLEATKKCMDAISSGNK